MDWCRRGLIIAAILAQFLSCDLQAQVGGKVGMSLSGLRSTNPDDFRPFLGHEIEWIQYGESRPVIGFQIGVFYSMRISEYFDLQPEVNFIQRGYWFDQTPLYDAKYVVRINYLELPVPMRYRVPIDAFDVRLFAGPFAAIKLGANGYIEYEGKEEVKSLTSVELFDYGIVMGLGSEANVGEGQMTFDVRFNWGLHNMMSQPSSYVDLYEDPGSVFNLAVALMIGYRFDSMTRRQEP